MHTFQDVTSEHEMHTFQDVTSEHGSGTERIKPNTVEEMHTFQHVTSEHEPATVVHDFQESTIYIDILVNLRSRRGACQAIKNLSEERIDKSFKLHGIHQHFHVISPAISQLYFALGPTPLFYLHPLPMSACAVLLQAKTRRMLIKRGMSSLSARFRPGNYEGKEDSNNSMYSGHKSTDMLPRESWVDLCSEFKMRETLQKHHRFSNVFHSRTPSGSSENSENKVNRTVATLRWRYGLLYKAFASWLASYRLLKNRISDKLARLSSLKSQACPSLCHLASTNSQAAARAAKTRSDFISHSLPSLTLPSLTLVDVNITEDGNPAAREGVTWTDLNAAQMRSLPSSGGAFKEDASPNLVLSLIYDPALCRIPREAPTSFSGVDLEASIFRQASPRHSSPVVKETVAEHVAPALRISNAPSPREYDGKIVEEAASPFLVPSLIYDPAQFPKEAPTSFSGVDLEASIVRQASPRHSSPVVKETVAEHVAPALGISNEPSYDGEIVEAPAGEGSMDMAAVCFQSELDADAEADHSAAAAAVSVDLGEKPWSAVLRSSSSVSWSWLSSSGVYEVREV